jgi:hypothetical protein
MANQETQIIDDILLKSRRKLLTLGAASIAGMAVGAVAAPKTAAMAASYSDTDILNFALNLEFLEANFYYIAAFGCTINAPNAAAIAAGAPAAGIPITGSVGTPGTVTYTGGGKVPFTTVTAGAYATETAIEEGKHVLTLQGALGSLAVAQPAINLGVGAGNAWTTLVAAANATTPTVSIPTTFSPYANDTAFLIGAYVFEDVGVTAYHGAASLLTGTTTTLPVAAGILGVEAYHAGLVRTSLNALDPTGSAGLQGYTTSISNLRATLSLAGLFGASGGPYDTTPDDFGIAPFITPQPLGSTSSMTATRITDADSANVIAFARNTNQVLNIVTGGGKTSATTVAKGVFFPSGMNAGPNGFS